MYKAEVYASGNRNSGVRTLFLTTYSWPALRSGLAGISEDFAWRYGNAQGEPCQIREPQLGEVLEFKVGTEAQFESGFTGTLVLSNDHD